MPDIPDSNWSERDERNAEIAPLGFPPGLPAQIELIGRMMMGAIKRFWNKINPAYQTAGSGDNYIVTPEGATIFINLYEIIRVRIDRTNTTATPTLKFGNTTARTIVKIGVSGIVPVIAGDLLAGQDHEFWYDGTQYILSNPATVDSSATVGLLKTANNLSELTPTAATARTNIGLGNVDNTSDLNKPISTATQTALNLKAPLASPALTGTPNAPTATQGNNSTQIATTAYVDTGLGTKLNSTGGTATNTTIVTPSGLLLLGEISGLTLSNDAGDLTNDIGIATGIASSDSATPSLMSLSSALIKRTDAAWAAGTNQGGWLDGASMPNGTGHVFLISGASGTDVGISASLTPTLPAGYNVSKRRIGSIIRASAAILRFNQTGDLFELLNPISEFNGTPGVTTAVTRTLSGVPVGIVVQARIHGNVFDATAANSIVYLSPLFATDVAAAAPTAVSGQSGSTSSAAAYGLDVTTNTSAQIRSRVSTTTMLLSIASYGWVDPRGK